MKKSELTIQKATAAEIAAKSAEQMRFVQALTLVPKGTYTLELIGGKGADKNDVAVYYPEYQGTDGQNHQYMAVVLNETGDIIPVSNLENATYLDDRGQFIVSPGVTPKQDNDKARWDALNESTKKFTFDVKKLRRVGGRRAMNKAIVTFI